ncbi:MAG: nucleotide disphospho-sugar-binding domain-containing protein [Chitinophagaceae bacterium]
MEKEKSINEQLAGRKILFANFPADGHFNPLTGLAMHLKNLGADVRWYSSKNYTDKLKKLQIHHYPFTKALDVIGNNFDKVFPERMNKKTQIGKLKFDIINAFILRGPEYYADIVEIYREFPFEILIADCAFTGIPFVKELMKKPVVAIGVFPLAETSKNLPPPGLGMMPSYTLFGKIKQALLRKIFDKLVFRQPNKVLHDVFAKYKIPHNGEGVFDILAKKSNLLLQSGTPSFEYYRSDLSRNIRFIGPLLPYNSSERKTQWFDQRLNEYPQVVLVTQGTVEKDPEKLLVPTLEAFKNSKTLVVCTTGGSQTQELREKYPQPNFIIEDFIPFSDVMPYADVYITNGGYGGVMLGIENRLPLIVAGIHEGKNEINARVGYFELGINLETETPSPQQIGKAVNEVFTNLMYKQNSEKLAAEFNQYHPQDLFSKYLSGLIPAVKNTPKKAVAEVY